MPQPERVRVTRLRGPAVKTSVRSLLELAPFLPCIALCSVPLDKALPNAPHLQVLRRLPPEVVRIARDIWTVPICRLNWKRCLSS